MRAQEEELIRDLYPSSKLIMYQNGVDFKNNHNLKNHSIKQIQTII